MQQLSKVNMLESNQVLPQQTITSYLHITSTHQNRNKEYITASQ